MFKKKNKNKGNSKHKANLSIRHLSPEQIENLVMDSREQARKLGCSMLRRWNIKIDLDELYSIVDLSLCEAAKHFNPNRNVTFITFLFYHLKGNLVKAISQAVNKTAVPYDFKDEDFESGILGHETINSADFAETLGSNFELQHPDMALYRGELFDIGFKACERLDALEKEVIYSVVLHEEQVTEIAKQLNFSRCYISKIKTQALSKLKGELEKLLENELEDYQASTIEQSIGKKRAAGKASAARKGDRVKVAAA